MKLWIPDPMRRRPARARCPGWLLPGAALAVIVSAGCAGARPGGTRVEDLPPSPAGDAAYRVTAGDVISVRVLNQEAMSQPRTRVRDDGRISLPFLQDVHVAGETPVAIAHRLEAALASYVVNPVVTVTLDEARPLRVPVIGQVTRPGVYDLERGAGVLPALAAAGGLTDFAHRDAVYVLRSSRDGTPLRIRFTFSALTRADPAAASFALRQGDSVVVE
jgi:polysaccharide export outer membrane protein